MAKKSKHGIEPGVNCTEEATAGAKMNEGLKARAGRNLCAQYLGSRKQEEQRQEGHEEEVK